METDEDEEQLRPLSFLCTETVFIPGYCCDRAEARILITQFGNGIIGWAKSCTCFCVLRKEGLK